MRRKDTITSAVRALVVILALGIAVYVWQKHSNEVIRNGQLIGCERGKADRAANAKAFRAQSDYLNLVLEAKSVKEDVKRAARRNQKVQDAAARSLESRTGDNLDCEKVYPKP